VGGDGTHRGVKALYEEIKKRQLLTAICALPKTIDNDIPIIDKSFGFESSVEESGKAIKSAYVEAHSAEFGAGLVRLMGRQAGFIAMEASYASRDVNICLVPEFKFEVHGPKGLLAFVAERVRTRRHCVIVVAEGAGSAMLDQTLPSTGTDASGNVKPGDIGTFLRDNIIKHCKDEGIDLTLKYIDPTYMIRTVPANAHDRELCIFNRFPARPRCCTRFNGRF
jgi:6-phosphofructokinase 1